VAERKILTHLDFGKSSELQNALVHKLASAPGSPVAGQLYYDTTANRLYFYNGTAWVPTDSSQIIAGNALTRTGDTLDVAPGTGLEVVSDLIRIAAAAAGEGLGGGGAEALKVNVDGTFLKIVGDVLTPQTEGTGTKLATTGYADAVAQGLDVKNSVRFATAAALSPTSTVSGKELVGEAVGELKIDGQALTVGDRVLVKNEPLGIKNGIYEVLSKGGGAEKYKLKRTADADAESAPFDLSGGSFTFVEAGGTNADTGWVISEPTGPVTVGVTANTWTQFTGAAGLTAGGGIGLAGSTLFVEAGTGLTQEGDGLSVNTAVIATKAFVEERTGKFTQNIGNGSLTAIEVTHNLGTRDVIVEVYRNSTPWDTVEPTVERTSVNAVTLRFNVAPTTEQYRVIVRS
jgi:hypothetical protein